MFVLLATLLTGAVATAALIPLVIRLAHRRGWLAYPRADRWHHTPTALMGGLGLFGGTVAALLVAGQAPAWWIAAGATLMFATGVVDDRRTLNPVAKLLAQVAAAALPLVAGVHFGDALPLFVSIPLTLLWVIGVTNAVNLIDGMDGLAAGIAGIAAGVLGAAALLVGDGAAAALAFGLAGACVGFLFYNVKPARIFMGDGGSLFLGYTLAAVALTLQDQPTARVDRLAILLVPIAVLAVPIFDTTLVTLMRVLNGRRVTQGGTDHLMHRLVFLGLSERRTVALLWAVGLVCGLVALSTFVLALPVVLTLAAGLVTALYGLATFVSGADVYARRTSTAGEEAGAPDAEAGTLRSRAGGFLRAVMGREWRAISGMFGDLVLVAAAFHAAHLLHGEHGVTEEKLAFVGAALPFVMVTKIAAFYALGLYRGIWRYAGTPELARIALANVLASLAVFGVVTAVFGAGAVSPAVLFIDGMIATIAAAAVRLGIRGAHHAVLAQRHTGGERVLLYGAGDAGLLSLRELRQNPDAGFSPVGFLDDDPLKRGMMAQGLHVLGGLPDLAAVCEAHRVRVVLVTASRMTAARRRQIFDACEAAGVECRGRALTFDPLARAAGSEEVLAA